MVADHVQQIVSYSIVFKSNFIKSVARFF